MRVDNNGEFWDTVFDVVSLCFSVVDVIKHPDNPWAWVGLTADVVLPAVPFVSGYSDIVSVYEQFRLYRSALFRLGTMPKDPFFVLAT